MADDDNSDDSVTEAMKRTLRVLDNLIHSSGRSRRDMDRALGVTRGYTGRVLTGETHLTYERLLQMMEVLRISPSTLSFVVHGPPRLPRGLWSKWVDRTESGWAEQGYGPVPSPAHQPPPPPLTDDEWRLILLASGLKVVVWDAMEEDELDEPGESPLSDAPPPPAERD